MTHHARLERTREIATVRRLLLQRALAEAARQQAAAVVAEEHQRRTEHARDTHLRTWRNAAASHEGLSPALLNNFASAFVPIALKHTEACEQRREQQAELDAVRQLLTQCDRLAELAEEHVSLAGKRHRQALDEKRMAQLEIRAPRSTEDQ